VTALEDIYGKYTRLSKELLLRLNKLHVDEKYKFRKWKSFKQALKSISSKDRVDDLARRIANCREELNSHLIVSIRYAVLSVDFRDEAANLTSVDRKKTDALSVRQDEAVATLTKSNQTTLDTLLETRRQLKNDLLDHSDHIIQTSFDSYGKAQESIKFTLEEVHSIEAYMLESLRFSTMDNRGEQIHEAHARTFR
jgi:hypothetical protein